MMRPFPRCSLWLALCVLAVLGSGTPVGSQVTREDGRTFGVVEAYYRPDEAALLRASWDRVIFDWNLFQPSSPDDFDTSAVPEEYLEAAQEANRQIVGLIKGTPPWVSDSHALGAVPENIALPYDDPDNFYSAFVMKLVEYYSERGIHHWIIMNEPDVRHGEGNVEFEGEVEDYFAMLKVAYLAARSVDPEAHIQIAGMGWWPDRNNHREPYLRRLLRLIANDPEADANDWYFDGITIHVYYTTSSVWPIIATQQQFLEDHGLHDKEVWLNEYNASPRLDYRSGYDATFEISLEQQADYIVQTSALALAAGVDRMAVYRLYDNHFVPWEVEPWGLVRFDGSLRPAFYAYQQVIERFSGAEGVRRFAFPQGTAITLSFPDYSVYVMWSDTLEPGEFLIHAGNLESPVTIYDAVGNHWEQPLTTQMGIPLAVVRVPPAEPIDVSWIVVAGEVRIITLEGSPRTIWFRESGGLVTQLGLPTPTPEPTPTSLTPEATREATPELTATPTGAVETPPPPETTPTATP